VEESPAPKPVTVPKMEFKHSSLPNGLEIYAVEDMTPDMFDNLTENIGGENTLTQPTT
jgi:hypothetical protein